MKKILSTLGLLTVMALPSVAAEKYGIVNVDYVMSKYPAALQANDAIRRQETEIQKFLLDARKDLEKTPETQRKAKEEKYNKEVVPSLIEKHGYKTPMLVPKIDKIVVNMGVGDATVNSKNLENAVRELEKITGLKAVETTAKKSIATFKIREGHKIGCKVTLRGDRMYNFLDKLISISLPRVRDFRGLSPKSFDGRGNYTIGIKEQIIFPEINFDEVEKVRGMDIVIVTTAKTNEEAYDLLKELGVPFRK